jgi:hypothetical protein
VVWRNRWKALIKLFSVFQQKRQSLLWSLSIVIVNIIIPICLASHGWTLPALTWHHINTRVWLINIESYQPKDEWHYYVGNCSSTVDTHLLILSHTKKINKPKQNKLIYKVKFKMVYSLFCLAKSASFFFTKKRRRYLRTEFLTPEIEFDTPWAAKS